MRNALIALALLVAVAWAGQRILFESAGAVVQVKEKYGCSFIDTVTQIEIDRGQYVLYDKYDKPAGGIHDILCQGEFVPIPLANLIFKEALEAMRIIPQWRVELMYKAVQIGTAASYRKHTLQSVIAARKLCRISFDHERPLWPDGKLRFV